MDEKTIFVTNYINCIKLYEVDVLFSMVTITSKVYDRISFPHIAGLFMKTNSKQCIFNKILIKARKFVIKSIGGP